MASQVLSGPSNPNYTNNTGQNVRIVINYMASTDGTPPQGVGGGFPQQTAPNIAPVVNTPGVAPSLTINWAGVSVTGKMGPDPVIKTGYYSILRGRRVQNVIVSGGPKFAIGRNISAAAAITKETPGFIESLFDDIPGIGGGEVSIATYAHNAGFQMGTVTMGITFPTELMLAPGQTFSAVCGVYNIVVIPENG